MKTMTERIRTRLKRDRPMTTISLRMPDDVIDDLKEIAPVLGFSGYQPLLRTYIGQGLRRDQLRMADSEMQRMAESLRRQGIADQVISTALEEARRNA